MTKKRKGPASATSPAVASTANASAAWPAYNVEKWAIADLKPFGRNARTHSAKQIEQLRSAIRSYGWTIPILAREDGTIIAGHGRFEAGKAEGLAEVPVIVARGWSEAQCRAYTIADNKLALNSEWDETVLQGELAELAAFGMELGTLGFEADELSRLLSGTAGHTGHTDPDAAPEAPAVPVATRGDVWALGRHRLLCGDSTNAEDVRRVLGGVSPHLMVTDPPYGVNYDPAWRAAAGLGRGATGAVLNDDRADWTDAWKLFPGSVAYVWHGGLHHGVVAESLKSVGFKIRAQIVWVKTRPVVGRGHYHWQNEPAFYATQEGLADDQWRFVPDHEVLGYSVREGETASWSGRRQSTVWFIEHLKSDTGHGTQKPVECMKRPIENNSSLGQAVYEPFCGSGTTIIAAEMTGRCCYAIELHPPYVDVAIKRWQEFTQQQAALLSDGRSFDEVAAERIKQEA